MISYQSGIKITKVVFVESQDSGDLSTGRHLFESISAFMKAQKVQVELYRVESRQGMISLLTELTEQAFSFGEKPIIHIDCHGGKEGLFLNPGNELLTWEELSGLLRSLNFRMENNLMVVLAACYGYHAITSVSIRKLTPFLYLIGPKKEISAGAISDSMPAFYTELFSSGDLEAAFKILRNSFEIFYAEKLLAQHYIKHLNANTRGTGGRARLQRLLTELKSENASINISVARARLKQLMKTDHRVFGHFKTVFLGAHFPSNNNRFKIVAEDCVALAKKILTLRSDGY